MNIFKVIALSLISYFKVCSSLYNFRFITLYPVNVHWNVFKNNTSWKMILMMLSFFWILNIFYCYCILTKDYNFGILKLWVNYSLLLHALYHIELHYTWFCCLFSHLMYNFLRVCTLKNIKRMQFDLYIISYCSVKGQKVLESQRKHAFRTCSIDKLILLQTFISIMFVSSISPIIYLYMQHFITWLLHSCNIFSRFLMQHGYCQTAH